MLGNRRLARSIADMGMVRTRRQFDYKAAWRGGRVVVADRWYPSSKTCSCCGYRLATLEPGVRRWTCPGCGGFMTATTMRGSQPEEHGGEFYRIWPVEGKALALCVCTG